MIEAFWIPLLPPYLIGLALSWAMEAMLTPRPVAPWRRPAAANAVHVGVWTLAFALELALFRRPYFGVANVLAIQLLIVLVSNAKYRALREPFVYPDFEYFMDAIKHPRLYLPFFGLARALAAGGGYGAALWAGLVLEDSVTAGAGMWLVSFAELPQEHPLDATAPMIPFYVHTLGLAVAGLSMAVYAGARNVAAFEASEDLQRLGLWPALWAYGRAEKQPIDHIRRHASFYAPNFVGDLPNQLPDLVVVQSESFFDARRAYPELLRNDVLANFDLIKSEAQGHGQLAVPGWGANTVRTEFAFLTGISADVLGIHRYNPYRKLGRAGLPSIASYLKTLGYRTVCVHPYHRDFYGRDEVLPLLGFDEFIGIERFTADMQEGAYIGDQPLGRYIADILNAQSDVPLYLHVITMENHGPLHWERVSADDVREVFQTALPDGVDDLVAYARHLRNADAMFGELRNTLLARGKPASLCIFGDHVPIMPKVYTILGETDGSTDYVYWNSGRRMDAPELHSHASCLAVKYLCAAFGWEDRNQIRARLADDANRDVAPVMQRVYAK